MSRHTPKNAGIIGKRQITILLICLLLSSCRDLLNLLNQLDPQGTIPHRASATAETAEPKVDHDYNFGDPTLTPRTNIHYTGRYCGECHEKTPVAGGPTYLKYNGDYRQLCRCHTLAKGDYIHPVDIAPSPEKKQRMPSDFPLEDGRVTCLTCHDIYLQCRKRLFNRTSLRGAPYPQRTDFCYRCHIRETHKRLDPHHQIDENGELIIANCLVCHTEKPDEAHATFKDVKFIADIEVMCRRCHHISGNHSGNADHMGILPSPEGMARIKAMEAKYNVRLPLDENGKMTCITCHNPHQRGVIPADRPGAKGADSKYRHRLPGNLCKECHQM